MLARLILAVVVAVAVGLVCVALLGPILVMIGVPISIVVGNFLIQWGWVLGILAGLWFFFSGTPVPLPWRRP